MAEPVITTKQLEAFVRKALADVETAADTIKSVDPDIEQQLRRVMEFTAQFVGESILAQAKGGGDGVG